MSGVSVCAGIHQLADGPESIGGALLAGEDECWAVLTTSQGVLEYGTSTSRVLKPMLTEEEEKGDPMSPEHQPDAATQTAMLLGSGLTSEFAIHHDFLP